jgi:branched-chain amino acid transport system substrate-binding protein
MGPVALTDEALLPRQGDNALGIVTTLPWSAALDTPGNKRFLRAYEAKYQRAPTLGSETGHVGAQMILT